MYERQKQLEAYYKEQRFNIYFEGYELTFYIKDTDIFNWLIGYSMIAHVYSNPKLGNIELHKMILIDVLNRQGFLVRYEYKH